jgi:ATP-dependent Lon protease
MDSAEEEWFKKKIEKKQKDAAMTFTSDESIRERIKKFKRQYFDKKDNNEKLKKWKQKLKIPGAPTSKKKKPKEFGINKMKKLTTYATHREISMFPNNYTKGYESL